MLSLAACGGGSGGGDGLTPAEHLFGAGIGTGQTPTHLIPREDGAGFEILSFGAWGNVYDIKETTASYISGGGPGAWRGVAISNIHNYTLFDFSGQQKEDIRANYRFSKDASVSNATFVGPAIVYNKDHSIGGDGFHANSSDYGTMKLQFGQDIDNWRLDFVMSDSANNATITSPDSYTNIEFTSDRKKVGVSYGNDEHVYIGYGSKQ